MISSLKSSKHEKLTNIESEIKAHDLKKAYFYSRHTMLILQRYSGLQLQVGYVICFIFTGVGSIVYQSLHL